MISAMTSANSAMASTSAKPSIVIVNTSPRAEGLRPTAEMNDENTLPMPMPAPMRPITARPAPTAFMAARKVAASIVEVLSSEWKVEARAAASVQVHRVVDVEAGQDGEHVGLQEGDEDFKAGQRRDERQRHDAGDAERRHEAGENLQQRVPGQHVGEQPHRERDRPREIGDELDRNE